MKTNLKNELRTLLSGKGKKGSIIASMKIPGVYEVEDKKYTEAEFSELKAKYETVIIFIHPDCQNLKKDPEDLNVEIDSEATGETLLKLRNKK
jgi:hypothetical protein